MTDNKQTLCRPIISSLAFNDQNIYLPFSYDFTVQQIQQIKKYLPKHLLKLHGVDVKGQTMTINKQEQEQLHKSKIKVKGMNGKWIDNNNNNTITYLPKQQVRVIQWYNKSITLTIPYSSKSTSIQIEEQINNYIDYYLDNFVVFKNTLNEQLYTGEKMQELMKEKKLMTVQQISTEVDVVFLEWCVEKDPNDDQQQTIRVNVPIMLCLNVNQTYSLSKIKDLIKTDIMSSIAIQLKHNFNTRVLIQGSNTKQYLCLNSYCNEESALDEEEKLRTIIGQQKHTIVETQETKLNAKKDHTFLILILASLVLIYFYLKIFPIHGRDENQYIKQASSSMSTNVYNSQMDNYTLGLNDQQIF